MARKLQFEVDEYYHVFNRGVEKRVIFLTPYDRERFLKLLYLCNAVHTPWLSSLQSLVNKPDIFQFEKGASLVDIGCYCLMGNHFHLLLKEKQENGISVFMQKLSTAYTMYFNIRNQRTGSLFEGTFRARHVDSDEYLKYMFAYIHLNPIEHIEPKWKENGIQDIQKVKDYLTKYFYSSWYEYQGRVREESSILTKSAFPAYFKTRRAHEKEINNWLEFTPPTPLLF